jgi:hypothetical protein
LQGIVADHGRYLGSIHIADVGEEVMREVIVKVTHYVATKPVVALYVVGGQELVAKPALV